MVAATEPRTIDGPAIDPAERERYLNRHGVTERAPPRKGRLGRFTVVCLVLNRTIGSGIFVTPALVLSGTGSVVKCIYGIGFLTLGNLAGNAIAFGIYVMNAAGHPNPGKGSVHGLAIAALSAAVLVHVLSRRGGIIINNSFAVLKVTLLIAIFAIGMAKAAGRDLGGAPKATSNFDTAQSFSAPRNDLASYSNSFLFIVYTYSGFEQPFYVLAEVRRPRKVFPMYTLIAMGLAVVLFVLVNIAYLCAVPHDLPEIAEQRNMAVVFFGEVFGDELAKRVMAGAIAISIFGNILVMTFTASRVKQEIAKEGILPFSLFFATSHTTPLAWCLTRRKGKPDDELLEQAPMAALGLHWLTSTFLVAVTSMLEPGVAYSFLISMYSYVIIILIGFFTSAGLVYLNLMPSVQWQPNFKPKGGWVYAGVYSLVCAFMLVAAFVPPEADSPYGYNASKIEWYIIPAIGLSVPLWGVAWYLGLRLVMAIRGRELIIERTPTTEPDEVPGQYVMVSERITQEWHVK
ncbi:hypothetical protein GQ53DRAFT_862956 [Thozetella sp. PMI_491]|nr:hypothetical protein GQ53DRAFT_862956 [Thozetella sp. PMI_491]